MAGGEWCVFAHGTPEQCLVRVRHQRDDYKAFRGAIAWAKKNGYHPSRVTVDRYPPTHQRGVVGYETAPVVNLRK